MIQNTKRLLKFATIYIISVFQHVQSSTNPASGFRGMSGNGRAKPSVIEKWQYTD